jgi:hypothetical protein
VDRIQQNIASTITVTLYRDGTAENPSPDSATVRIVRADGTELVAETAAIDDGTGVFAYTLSPTQTATLDTLTAAWTVEFDGVAQTVSRPRSRSSAGSSSACTTSPACSPA